MMATEQANIDDDLGGYDYGNDEVGHADQDHIPSGEPEHIDIEDDHADERKTAIKPKSNVIKYAVMALFAASLPLGYVMVQGFLNHPAAIAPQVTMPPPIVAPIAPPAPPVEQPGGYDPTLDINGQSVNGQGAATTQSGSALNGQPTNYSPGVTGGVPANALPNTTGTVAPASNMAPASTMNANGMPVANAPQLPGTSASSVTPSTVTNNTSAPAFNAPGSTAVSPATPNMSSGVIKPAAVNNLTASSAIPEGASNAALLERVNKLEARVDVLEDRVNIHRDWLGKLRHTAARLIEGSDIKKDEPVIEETKVVNKPEPKPRPIRRAAPKVIAEAKPVPVPVTPLANPSIAPTQVSAAAAMPVTTQAPPAARNRTNYTLTAAVPGRAHIQSSEGTRIDITVGDSVPSCGRVNKIDADSGEVITDGCTIR